MSDYGPAPEPHEPCTARDGAGRICGGIRLDSRVPCTDGCCIWHTKDESCRDQVFQSLKNNGDLWFTAGTTVTPACIELIRRSSTNFGFRPVLRNANFSRCRFEGEINLESVDFISDSKRWTTFAEATMLPQSSLHFTKSRFSGPGSVTFNKLAYRAELAPVAKWCAAQNSRQFAEHVGESLDGIPMPASPSEGPPIDVPPAEPPPLGSALSFRHTKFVNEGEVLFADMALVNLEQVDFTGSNFKGPAEVNFSEAEIVCTHFISFSGLVHDSYLKEARLSFKDTSFQTLFGNIDFSDAILSATGRISFNGACLQAGNQLSFTNCRVSGPSICDFVGTSLTALGCVSFYGASFTNEGGVAFSGSTIAAAFGSVTFSRALFSGEKGAAFTCAIFEAGRGQLAKIGSESIDAQKLQKLRGLWLAMADEEWAAAQTSLFEEMLTEPGPNLFDAFNGSFKEGLFSEDIIGSVGFVNTRFLSPSGVDFSRATFTGDSTVSFLAARFLGSVSFARCRFESHDPVSFASATFAQRTTFTPAKSASDILFRNAQFDGSLDLEISTKGTVCLDHVVANGYVNAKIRPPVKLCLQDTHCTAEMVISGERLAESDDAGSEHREDRGLSRFYRLVRVVIDLLVLRGRRERSKDVEPELLSLSGTNCTGLTLRDLDLRSCKFSGALHLDCLSLYGTRLPRSSEKFVDGGGDRYGGKRWYFCLRQMIYDEAVALTAVRDDPRLQVAKYRSLERLYRSLRKGLEDEKNEAGASDFYYGEMTCRRKACGHRLPGLAEWFLLTLYAWSSAYGTRAWRAAALLLLVVVSFSAALQQFGFASVHKPGYIAAAAVVLESSISLLRTPIQRYPSLNHTGLFLEYAVRVLGPILFALLVVSLRSRIKR